MFERAVVHVGLHKTGTTSLQRTFFRNAATLERQAGVYYPRLASNHSVFLCPLFSPDPHHYYVSRRDGADNRDDADRRNAKVSKKLEAAFAGTSAKTLLLSGEDLSNLNPPGLERMKAWLDAHARRTEIIVFVRDPIRWATSGTQQRIKAGATFQDLRERPPLEAIRQKLTKLLKVFGRDALSVHRFEDAVAVGILSYFCRQTGISEAWCAGTQPERHNEALSHESAHLAAAINARFPLTPNARFMPQRAHGDTRSLSRASGNAFRLPPDIAALVRAPAERDVRWLRETFGIDYGPLAAPAEAEIPDSLPLPTAAELMVAVTVSATIREQTLLSQIALLKGDIGKARQHFENILAIDPGNAAAEARLAELSSEGALAWGRRLLRRLLAVARDDEPGQDPVTG